jgi:hypothetical protein
MTTSILNDALILRKDTPEKLQEYLYSINLTIFDPIFHNSADLKEAQQTILFILCAYSEDSPLLILRRDNKEEADSICEYLQIPEYIRHKLITLSDNVTRRAVTQYVMEFAGPLFRSYSFLKIQANDFELDITNRAYTIKKTEVDKDGKETITEIFDTKEHGKAIIEHARILRTIKGLEEQIKQQIKRMEGIEDMQKFAREGKESGAIKGERRGNVEKYI